MNFKKLATSILIGAVAIGAVGCGGSKPTTSANPVSSTERVAASQPSTIEYQTAGTYTSGLGIMVTKALSYDKVWASNQFATPIQASTGQQLVVIDLQLSHTGKSPISLSEANWQLVDAEGRRFNPMSYSMTFQLWVDETRANDLGMYEALNPGSRKTETLIFEVPADAQGLQLAERNVFLYSLS